MINAFIRSSNINIVVNPEFTSPSSINQIVFGENFERKYSLQEDTPETPNDPGLPSSPDGEPPHEPPAELVPEEDIEPGLPVPESPDGV